MIKLSSQTIISFILATCSLHAAVLDWDTVDWSQGAETQTYHNVGGSGIDITISLSLSYDWESHGGYRNGYWTQTGWVNGSPNDNTDLGGDGGIRDEESLKLDLNFASDDRVQSYLDVSISFSEAVDSASFQIFDIDAYGTNYWGGYESGIQFVDIIEQVEGSLNGVSVAGSVTHANNDKILDHTDANGTYYEGNTLLGDGGADHNDNPSSTLNLSWDSPVDQLSFRYSPGSRSVADPGNQAIGLSDINFCDYQAVPEASTVIAAVLIPLLGIVTYRRRRAKAKNNLSSPA